MATANSYDEYNNGSFIETLKFITEGRDSFSSYIGTYTIPLKYKYRPDLISYEIYGNVENQDFLSYFNSISNSPEGYYTGRTIKYISLEKVGNIL